MHEYLPYIVIGLTSGSIYGLAAVGLVLTYKTSGIFNFAYGSIAAMAALLFYFLDQECGLPWPLALVISCVVFGPGLGIVFELLARSLATASTIIKVVATIGLVLIVLSLGELLIPGNPREIPQFLPNETVQLFGVYVSWSEIIIFLMATFITVALFFFLRVTRIGISMRAVVDNPDLVARFGDRPVRVRRWAWIIGNTLASISGIVLALGLNLDVLGLTLLVVQAFGAAAIGAFSNLPLTFAGGLVIGIAAALATKFTANYPALVGLSGGLPFIILIAALIVTPKARLAVVAVRPIVEVHRSWQAPPRFRLGAAAIAVFVLAVLPTFAGSRLVVYSSMLVMVVLFLSLGLLVRASAQVSLCQFGFAAVGAASMAHFTSQGVPWLFAALLASLVVVPVGALVAIPAIRLSGVFLALATLGFGILLAQMFYSMNFLFGPTAVGIPANRPSGGIGGWHFGSDNGYYYVLLCFVVFAVVVVAVIERGRLGRLLRAMADSPLALQSGGAALVTTKVLVFCVSAFLAGLAGALNASLYQYAQSSEYSSFSSLTLFALLVIITVGEPWYALIAAFLLVVLPSFLTGLSSNINTYFQLLFGISALLYVYTVKKPLTVPRWLRERLAPSKVTVMADVGASTDDGATPVPSDADLSDHIVKGELEVVDLTVRFGGVVAVDELTFSARAGVITGLIGPNGAGKTTTFAACSGLEKSSHGVVRFGGRDVTRLSPDRRARVGIGRTFQRVELYNSLTVEENVAMGCEAALAGARPWRQLVTRRSERRLIQRVMNEAIAETGIEQLRHIQVGLLPTGQRRLVELARALAGPFDLLLLDEPSSGLDGSESRQFGQTLRSVVSQRGIGILLVEHDMTLVREICDDVYVLDYGRLVFHGSAEDMVSSAIVRSAYLGTDAAYEASHGAGHEALE